MADCVYVGIRKYAKGIKDEIPQPIMFNHNTLKSLEEKVNFAGTDARGICKKKLLKEEKYGILKLSDEYKGRVIMLYFEEKGAR